MIKGKKKAYPSVHFGTALMLTVFVILCLTAFATLSLSSAMRDYEYSKKTARHKFDYYKADGEANEILADILVILKDTAKSEPANYMKEVTVRLKDIPKLDIDGDAVSYTVPVNDRQALQVTLALYDPGASENGLYRISKWKEISTKEWNSSTTLPVIGSDQ